MRLLQIREFCGVLAEGKRLNRALPICPPPHLLNTPFQSAVSKANKCGAWLAHPAPVQR